MHEALTLTTQCRVSMPCHGPTLAPEKLQAHPIDLTVVLQLSMKCGVALQVTVVVVRKPLPGTLRETCTRVWSAIFQEEHIRHRACSMSVSGR
jgi:hypothetical protein